MTTDIYNDNEFTYLKWLMNKLQHIRNLHLDLTSEKVYRADQSVWKSRLDADFVRQHCLPDSFPNLIDFRFYIVSRCEHSHIDTAKILHSFRTHPCFIEHQWHDVQCMYDHENGSQHLLSSGRHTTRLRDPVTYVSDFPTALN